MRYFLGLLLITSLMGCSTVGSLKVGSGGSTFDIRGKTYDEIWNASVRAVSGNLTIVEINKNTGMIKAEKGPGWTTWGEVVGVFIQPTSGDADVYTVEVQSLKRVKTQITGQDWTLTIKSGILAQLQY